MFASNEAEKSFPEQEENSNKTPEWSDELCCANYLLNQFTLKGMEGGQCSTSF